MKTALAAIALAAALIIGLAAGAQRTPPTRLTPPQTAYTTDPGDPRP